MAIIKLVYGITLLVLIVSSCTNSSQNAMARFTGMWKLDKYESFDSAGSKWYDTPNRTGYTGYILYDGTGHMGVQLLPPGYKEVVTGKNTDSLSAEELRKILSLQSASFSYFATCALTEEANSIAHHRLSSNNPEEWGTTIKRSFEFKGDTLILTASELIGGLKTRLRWIKL